MCWELLNVKIAYEPVFLFNRFLLYGHNGDADTEWFLLSWVEVGTKASGNQ